MCLIECAGSVMIMENHRNDVVVIFAGYPDKMESFLQKNPGLRSRIAYHVPLRISNSRRQVQSQKQNRLASARNTAREQ